jgi:transposase
MFAGEIAPTRVAQLLGITRKSAYEWYALWRRGGRAALVSKGAASGRKLTDEQLARLEAILEEGAAAHGWDDGRWTTARVAMLIAERFQVSYTVRGVAYLLDRLGWTGRFRLPVRRAERQTGRQAVRQTGQQADRQTGRQARSQSGRRTGSQAGSQAGSGASTGASS